MINIPIIDKLNIGNENFLDVLVTITDGALIDVEDDKLRKHFQEAYIELIRNQGTPWVSVLSEYVHMAETAKLASSFSANFGNRFKPQEVDLKDYKSMMIFAGLMHDIVRVLKIQDAPEVFSQLTIEEKLSYLKVIDGDDNTSGSLAEKVMDQVYPSYSHYVREMVCNHGSSTIKKRKGNIKGIGYVVPLVVCDVASRVTDRYANAALGTAIIERAARALRAIKEHDSEKINQQIKKINKQSHNNFIPIYLNGTYEDESMVLSLKDVLGNGYKGLNVDEALTGKEYTFLLKKVNIPRYINSVAFDACQKLLFDVQKEVSGERGTFSQIMDLFSNYNYRLKLITHLPDLYERKQNVQVND